MEDSVETLFFRTLLMETVDFQSFDFSYLGPALVLICYIVVVVVVNISLLQFILFVSKWRRSWNHGWDEAVR